MVILKNETTCMSLQSTAGIAVPMGYLTLNKILVCSQEMLLIKSWERLIVRVGRQNEKPTAKLMARSSVDGQSVLAGVRLT